MKNPIGMLLHGFRQQPCAQSTGIHSRDWLTEKDPHMTTVARPRSFQCSGYFMLHAGCKKGCCIPLPMFLIKIRRQKPARVACEQWIHPCNKIIAPLVVWIFPAQIIADDGIGYRDKALIRTFPAFYLGFLTDALHPFIAAHRRIARLACFGVVPAMGKNIFPATE